MSFNTEFLSQDDVDELMSGMTGESIVKKEEKHDEGGIRTYNMATDERIVRSRMPTMDMLNERFSRTLRQGLFNFIHRNADITYTGMKTGKYSDFIKHLVVPTNINLMQAKPLRGTFLIVFDAGLVFNVVDSMFGGTGKFHTRIEGRDFTQTEMRIIRGILSAVVKEYQKAWEPVAKLEIEYVRSEMNASFANVATPSEIVITSSFGVELGTQSAVMHICFPYTMLEPIREKLYSTMQTDHLSEDSKWTGLLSSQLKTASVDLNCEFGSKNLTLRDLLAFKKGDIIGLDVPGEIECRASGMPVFTGRRGTCNGKYAIKINNILNYNQEELLKLGK